MLSWGLKHTDVHQNLTFKVVPSQMEESTVFYIFYLFTEDYSFFGPNMFVLYGQGVFFSQVGLAYGCVLVPAGCLRVTG